MSIDRVSVIRAFVETRSAHARLRTRDDIARHQARLWRRLAPTLAKTPALSSLAGAPLEAFPIIEPADMRARLGDWNSLGLDGDAIHAAAEAAEQGRSGEAAPGVFAGFSTGSAGARGAFLSSRKERARYLGQSLAKLLPDPVLRRRRIGLCLRANNALYRDVSAAGPFTFRYISLSAPAHERAREIEAFAPDIFIAPAHVLAELARLSEGGEFVPPRFERLFYGAEPMGARERDWVACVLGARPDPIYQATEGFLGAACPEGALHLNEDSIVFEFERIAASNRRRLIVTDLRRTSQPMVRVRLDDVVEPMAWPCPCGLGLKAIHAVEGRIGDAWTWGQTLFFPRDVEDAVSGALPAAVEWRATASPLEVRLFCDHPEASLARLALAAMLEKAGVFCLVTLAPLGAPQAVKRRRVQWADG